MNAIRLRLLNNVPNNAFVQLPDAWRQVGYVPAAGGFEVQPSYSDGNQTLSEVEALQQGIAWFRVQIDKFTVRDYRIVVR